MTDELQLRVLADVADYYSERIKEHGDTAQGVDWNRLEEQVLRFDVLMQIAQDDEQYTINDFGCGYGALYQRIRKDARLKQYTGIDVSKEMIEQAKGNFDSKETCANFILGNKPEKSACYTVASGIFNVKLRHSETDWQQYFFDTLDIMNEFSERGFAFNALTGYSDEDRKEARLYYADPCELFDFCKKRYSQNVALLHDYNLYEFTILVRK